MKLARALWAYAVAKLAIRRARRRLRRLRAGQGI